MVLKEGEIICSKCNGTGLVGMWICPNCCGEGKLDWIDNVFGSRKIRFEDLWKSSSGTERGKRAMLKILVERVDRAILSMGTFAEPTR